MPGKIYEIMTKATISKGLKKTIHKYEFNANTIDKILGCWITNHRYVGKIIDGLAYVEGDFDIHLWYAFQHESFLQKQQIHYKDQIDLSPHTSLKEDVQVVVNTRQLPKCLSANLQGTTMIIEIEKEVALKIVGDATILVESQNNDQKPIDINPDFIT